MNGLLFSSAISLHSRVENLIYQDRLGTNTCNTYFKRTVLHRRLWSSPRGSATAASRLSLSSTASSVRGKQTPLSFVHIFLFGKSNQFTKTGSGLNTHQNNSLNRDEAFLLCLFPRSARCYAAAVEPCNRVVRHDPSARAAPACQQERRPQAVAGHRLCAERGVQGAIHCFDFTRSN